MKLRKWVKYLLTAVCIISVVIMASECEDTFTFVISHILAFVVFVMNTNILLKY